SAESGTRRAGRGSRSAATRRSGIPRRAVALARPARQLAAGWHPVRREGVRLVGAALAPARAALSRARRGVRRARGSARARCAGRRGARHRARRCRVVAALRRGARGGAAPRDDARSVRRIPQPGAGDSRAPCARRRARARGRSSADGAAARGSCRTDRAPRTTPQRRRCPRGLTELIPTMHRTIIEPFKIKVVEPLPLRTVAQRERILADAGYNLFGVRAADVTFDFLTDSGTSAMSAAQWSAMMVAAESYAGSRSFYRFEQVVQRITGYHHIIPTHQGRAAEHLLFSLHCRPGQLVPSNNHFDTTRANLEQLGVEAVDLVCAEGKDPVLEHPFKGNVDVPRLEVFLR